PMTAEGFALYAPDRPGWGMSEGPRGHLASYREALYFIEQMVAKLDTRHVRVHLAGLSWGGKLALYAALRRPILFETLTLIAPGLAPRKDLSFWQKSRVAAGVLFTDGSLSIPLAFQEEDFTRRSDRQDYIRTDPYRVRAVSAAFCVESLKMDRYIEAHIPQLRVPTQLLLAGDDAIVDNAATDRLFSLAGGFRKRTVVHEGAAHSLVFESPERTAREIGEWMGEDRRGGAEKRSRPHPRPQKILVMGAGAVGSAVGGLLALGGHRVTLVARQEHAGVINAAGLCFKLGASVRVIRENLRAARRVESLWERPDLVLLCVKSFDTDQALVDLIPIMDSRIPILSLQNGVTNEHRVAELYPENPVIAGAICAYLHQDEAGEVCMDSDRGGLVLGPWNPSARAATAQAHAWLSDTGIEVRSVPEGRLVKWSKLMLNVAFNPLSALTKLGAAEILSDPHLGDLAVAAYAECGRVMRAQGIEPIDLPGYSVRRLARVVRLPRKVARRLLKWALRREPPSTSSMAQDLVLGRSEIRALNGILVELGRAHRIPTPANEHLLRCVEQAIEDPLLLEKSGYTLEGVAEGWAHRRRLRKGR
ncbi:MAG: 2-dehydropantoate 2-reductase, partial [Planctomycetota bacterium]